MMKKNTLVIKKLFKKKKKSFYKKRLETFESIQMFDPQLKYTKFEQINDATPYLLTFGSRSDEWGKFFYDNDARDNLGRDGYHHEYYFNLSNCWHYMDEL